MKVVFKQKASNSEAVVMEVDGLVENKNVPYSKKYLLDCRGLAVYVFCMMTGNSLHDLEFEDEETKRLVHCNYHYMNNPKYVVGAIIEGRIKK